MRHDRIAIIDFGGQYAHLIATKIRRLHVLAEILHPEQPAEAFAGYQGIILSGSPSLSSEDEDNTYDKRIFEFDIPILGFCFGHQEIAKYYGGRVEHTQREYGPAKLRTLDARHVFRDLPDEHVVWMSHGDTVTALPDGFEEIGQSIDPDGAVHSYAAIADHRRKRYGFQFHPEVDDTVYGEQMLANFVFDVCGCKPTWTMDNYLEEQLRSIREQVGDHRVFLLVSGGVDSTVAAELIGRAIGPERLEMLHIDNGLLRKDESRKVIESFQNHGLGKNLHFVDASDTFLSALEGVVEPERKRRIIGETFVRVFEQEAQRLDLQDVMLGQGTIYPDTIESGGSKRADVIKTHHNRVQAIERLIEQGKVIEPLAELYKVEVRELGEKLGIDPELLWRHPFPGPGLGVRVLCSHGTIPEDYEPEAVQSTIDSQASKWNLKGKLLPVRSVGVKADLRSYELAVLLWGEADGQAILAAAAQVYGRVPGVNRCVYDLTGQGMREATPVAATLTKDRLDLAREADQLVMHALQAHGLMRDIWQSPTVLLPLQVNGKGREVVILRPVKSERAMTAQPVFLPSDLTEPLVKDLMALDGVGAVWLDVTTKPPGTIEWE